MVVRQAWLRTVVALSLGSALLVTGGVSASAATPKAAVLKLPIGWTATSTGSAEAVSVLARQGGSAVAILEQEYGPAGAVHKGRLLVSSLAAGSTRWSSPRVISPAGQDVLFSHAAVAADGTVVIAWLRDTGRPDLSPEEIWTRTLAPSGHLSPARRMFEAVEDVAPDFTVAVGPTGGAAILWTRFLGAAVKLEAVRAVDLRSDTWSATTSPVNAPNTAVCGLDGAYLDAAGALTAAWTSGSDYYDGVGGQCLANDVGSDFTGAAVLAVSTLPVAATAWSSPRLVGLQSLSTQAAITADPAGGSLLVYSDPLGVTAKGVLYDSPHTYAENVPADPTVATTRQLLHAGAAPGFAMPGLLATSTDSTQAVHLAISSTVGNRTWLSVVTLPPGATRFRAVTRGPVAPAILVGSDTALDPSGRFCWATAPVSYAPLRGIECIDDAGGLRSLGAVPHLGSPAAFAVDGAGRPIVGSATVPAETDSPFIGVLATGRPYPAGTTAAQSVATPR